MDKTKIYFASNWGQSSKEITDFYKRQSPLGNGTWNSIQSVNNINDCDFVIVLDDTKEFIPFDKKIIFLGREPNHVIPREISKKWEHNSYNFLHHEFNNCWLAQTWWVDMNYETLNDPPAKKTKNLSVIDSGKVSIRGHVDRINAIHSILNKYPHDIDLYGNITNHPQYHNTPYCKHSLPHKDKRQGLIDYRYSLVIENGQTDYYFSEKISDSIMCWTTPIYFGCRNIHKFLPEGSYINIDINDPNFPDRVMEIISSNYHEDNLDKLIDARKLIMDKYNIWPTIEKAIDKKTFI